MEQTIGDATVVVLKYNMASSQWVELGSESGPCKISLLKSTSNEYRFVAWKNANSEVVLNSFLFATMHYNSTTATFHQWYDETKSAFGLNFIDPNEAKKFAIAVGIAIETLNETKITKPAGDSLKITKKTIDAGPLSGFLGRQASIDSSSKITQPSSNYNVASALNISPTNNSSTKKEQVIVVAAKADAGAPPPPGPPPAAPPPPGLPPSGPTVSIKKPASGNDFASQLKTASQNIKSSTTSANSDNKSQELVMPAKAPTSQPAFSAAPMDFLSELKMKAQKRPSESMKESVQMKKNEVPKAPSISVSNTLTRPMTNQSSKLSASNSDLSTTSFVTPADLENFRVDLMQDILLNMEKMKNEIISNILAKLN